MHVGRLNQNSNKKKHTFRKKKGGAKAGSGWQTAGRKQRAAGNMQQTADCSCRAAYVHFYIQDAHAELHVCIFPIELLMWSCMCSFLLSR